MRKLFFFAALLAIFASCTKNELAPMYEGDQEITYLTAPLTKATSSYGTDNKFYSFAYLVQGYGSNWAANSSDATTFIDHALISYNNTDKQWKATTDYYWPRDQYSRLTFFAWGDGTASPDNTIGDCSKDEGITFDNYDVTTVKNRDLMVAKIAADQKSNSGTYKFDDVNSGVPTLFYHVLSSLDIRAQRAKEYANTTFKIVSIKFNKVSVEGSYEQGIDASKLPTAAGSWTESNPKVIKDVLEVYTPADATQVDGLATATPETFTSLTPDDYSVFLPHSLDDSETVTIVYTINNGLSTETVTVTKSLKQIFTSWEAGKKYTLTITLSLDEILWDPAVEDWDATGSGSWTL